MNATERLECEIYSPRPTPQITDIVDENPRARDCIQVGEITTAYVEFTNARVSRWDGPQRW